MVERSYWGNRGCSVHSRDREILQTTGQKRKELEGMDSRWQADIQWEAGREGVREVYQMSSFWPHRSVWWLMDGPAVYILMVCNVGGGIRARSITSRVALWAFQILLPAGRRPLGRPLKSQNPAFKTQGFSVVPLTWPSTSFRIHLF